MHSLAFLWFQLQMAQRYLHAKTFEPTQSPANSAILNTPIGAGTLRRASFKQVPRMASAKQRRVVSPEGLASLAVKALVEEAELTPKPALVDGRGPDAQADLSLSLMRHSAHHLAPFFELIALTSLEQIPTQTLREELGTIGRLGEHSMLVCTGQVSQVNTHRGAIWSLGLLVSAAAMGAASPEAIAETARQLACPTRTLRNNKVKACSCLDNIKSRVLVAKLKPVSLPLLRLGCQGFICRARLMRAKHWHALMLYSPL
jgi:ATP:dephospho-CoA triphosphoribosyl transferase